ncbi:MAG TPA: hypothetical protein PLV92_07785 [Pirellulaceae bacterium]|nr:hypothetical protein [Pirellulaceae bacterium]
MEYWKHLWNSSGAVRGAGVLGAILLVVALVAPTDDSRAEPDAEGRAGRGRSSPAARKEDDGIVGKALDLGEVVADGVASASNTAKRAMEIFQKARKGK